MSNCNKYRIIVEENKRGDKKYIPQYKGWFLWNGYGDHFSFASEDAAREFIEYEVNCKFTTKEVIYVE